MAKKVGLGWYWAGQFNKVPVGTLRALYAEMRALTVAKLGEEKPLSVKELESYMETLFQDNKSWGYKSHKCSDPSLRILVLANQFVRAYNQQTRIPPSEETLAWGGFLGGETINNDGPACERLNALVAKYVPGLSIETVGGYS
jgi:hypothetical protein